MKIAASVCFIAVAGMFCVARGQSGSASMPRLEHRGSATQLVTDGKPMLILGGELFNSSSSSLDYMKPEWKQLADLGLNTVLTPVSWELIEPEEGKYDFALVDGLLAQAREQHMKLIFLWLAAWKNGVSGYPPAWVKTDVKRFPRVIVNGRNTSTLSTFAPALRDADAKSFKALMEHLKTADAQEHTVLMMQVENEVGVLGASRDHSPAANQAFSSAVPEALLRYLTAHRAMLNEELRTLWEASGAKQQGTWTEVFGDSARSDEIFMAWNYARYVNAVTAAGKSAYPLPMYVNAWLGGGDTPPGDYPSGGPQPRVIDVWKAAGDEIDMESPDLYASGFADWSKRYTRPDNPLFLPETNGGSAGAAAIFVAFGEFKAIGFSPFAIDAGLHGETYPGWETSPVAKGRSDLASSYHLLAEIEPAILDAQQRDAIHGFMLDKSHPRVDFVMHGLTLQVSLDEIFGHGAESAHGLLIEESPGHFLGAGKGFRVRFVPRSDTAPEVGIASIDEGHFHDGTWMPGRRLNGDEADQGGYWRFDPRENHIERAVIYELK